MEMRAWTEVREISGRSSSQQSHSQRTSLFLEVIEDGYRGVGEIAPHDSAVWFDPARADVLDYLRGFLAHRLDGRRGEGSSVLHLTDASHAARPAAALLEMALLDWALQREGREVEDVFRGSHLVQPQVTRSAIAPSAEEPATGALRIKVAPGISRDRIAMLAQSADTVILDANGEVVDFATIESWLTTLHEGQLRAVEQPVRPGDWNSSVPLVEAGIPIYLDESIRTVTDVRHAAKYRSATGVCVKVERVGGFAMASRLIVDAQERGLDVYLGGFFESPWAKRWMHAFASQFPLGASDVGDGYHAPRPEPSGDVIRIA